MGEYQEQSADQGQMYKRRRSHFGFAEVVVKKHDSERGEPRKQDCRDAGHEADRKAKASEITMNLPAIIARAVNIMRVEAEGLIGLEARRTVFSAQDPMAMFNEARLAGSQSDFAGARNRAIAAYEEEDDALLPAPVPELDLSDSSEDQWTFSARIR